MSHRKLSSHAGVHLRVLLLLCFTVPLAMGYTPGLERLKYNNPGLVVELGVGLWAWPMPMDYDGDGDLDLVVNCPDKPYNGVYFFENVSGDTSKNKMPVFKPGRRVCEGKHNAQVCYINGKPCVLTNGTEYPDFLKTGFTNGVKLTVPKIHDGKIAVNLWRYVDYDGDNVLDLIVGLDDYADYGWDNAFDAKGKWTNGPLHGYVYYLHNKGTNEKPQYDAAVKVMAGDKPIDVYGRPCPNFGDFDGDSDLDIICGEFIEGFTYFENIGTRTQPVYAPGRRLTLESGAPLKMEHTMITPTAIDWDKDGDLDLICGDEDGLVAFIENTGKLNANHMPIFLPPAYFKQEADEVKFGVLATPVGVDWDGDGDMDLICGNSAGFIGFIENLSGSGVEKPRWAAPKLLKANGKVIRIQAGPNGSIQGPAEAKFGYTTLSVADWDGDGIPDLVVNSIWGKVIWYRNIGTRNAPKLDAPRPIEVEWDGPQPALAWGWLRPEGKGLLTQWRTTPVAFDWNRDGLMDLIMLDQEGYLAFFERACRNGKRVLLPPKRAFFNDSKPFQVRARAAGHSGRSKIAITDWDGDGKFDFLISSANARLMRQTEAQDGKWTLESMGNLSELNIEAHDVSPTTVDFNGDGILDYLGGAEDGHFYYLKNPRSKNK